MTDTTYTLPVDQFHDPRRGLILEVQGETGLETLDALEAKHGAIDDSLTYQFNGTVFPVLQLPLTVRIAARTVLGAGLTAYRADQLLALSEQPTLAVEAPVIDAPSWLVEKCQPAPVEAPHSTTSQAADDHIVHDNSARATIVPPSSPIDPIFGNIPSAFTAVSQWVCRIGKVPVMPSGRNASSTDPSTWSTSAEVVEAYQRRGFDGIGFMLGGKFWFIDYDHVLDAKGQFLDRKIEEEVNALIAAGAYCDRSPSGTGVHVMGTYSGDPRLPGRKTAPREAYVYGRYATMTGWMLPGQTPRTSLPDTTEVFVDSYSKHFSDDDESLAFIKTTMRGPRKSEELPQDHQTLVEQLKQTDPQFRQLWSGDISPAGKDKSKADYMAACTLARRVQDPEALEAILRCSGLYREKWDRPDYLPRTIARVFARTPTAKDEFECVETEVSEDINTETTKYEFKQDWTDAGNANLLVSLSKGRLRFIPETKSWLHWDGKRWQGSTTRTIPRRHATRVAEQYHAEIRKRESTTTLDEKTQKDNQKTIEGLKKWEKTCRSKKSIDAMIDLTSTHPRVELSVAHLDAQPTLLGVSNGVVDLQTGQLRDAAQDEYITLACPVPYQTSATAPIWERTIAEVTGRPGMTANDYTPRPEVAEFLQRVLGYALTGLIREHTMFFFNGAGGNGKNVVADTMRFILGDYATGLPSSCLLQNKYLSDGERPTPYAAGLYRKRFVVASETKAGFKLDTEFVKSQTGDTFQKARHLRQDPFEFESTHKLFLMTNAMPEIDHLDEAIRGRLIVFPFERTWNRPNHPEPNPALPDADPTLSEQLRKEAPGILRWLAAGAVNYFTHGLTNAPAAVKARTLGYLAEQDGMAQWLKERCVPCEHKEGLSATGLREDYNAWAQENGKGSMSQKQFSAGLRSRHFEVKDTWRDGRNHKLYTLRLKRPYDHIFDE
jgi:P4 family phage/plasmid primase-like protien